MSTNIQLESAKQLQRPEHRTAPAKKAGAVRMVAVRS